MEKLISTRSEHKIIVGDFNLTLNCELDRENTYCNNNKARDQIENMMDQYQLRDIWRVQNEEKREFSWMKKSQYPIKASRIDFALVSGGLDQSIEMSMYVSSVFTDHRAFYMVVNMRKCERGVGYWKLNNSLLQDKKFLDCINEEIELTIQSSQGREPLGRWELVKKRVKDAAIRFSKSKVSEDNHVIAQLSEKVNEYEARLPLTREEN